MGVEGDPDLPGIDLVRVCVIHNIPPIVFHRVFSLDVGVLENVCLVFFFFVRNEQV